MLVVLKIHDMLKATAQAGLSTHTLFAWLHHTGAMTLTLCMASCTYCFSKLLAILARILWQQQRLVYYHTV